MKPQLKLMSVLRIAVSLSLIGVLFYLRRGSLGQTAETIRSINPLLFLSCCMLFLSAAVLFATRLRLILSSQGLSLRLSETIYLTFIGYFFNNFLPTSIGGDVVKAYYAHKRTGEKLKTFVSVFMDRFTGFLSVFIIAGFSLFISYRIVKIKFLIAPTIAILATMIFMLLIFFNKNLARLFKPLLRIVDFLKLRKKIEDVYSAINTFSNKKIAILKAIAISITAQMIIFCILYLFARGMGTFIQLKMVLLFMPLVFILSMLPSINGLGIREGAIFFLFSPYVGEKSALALGILMFFLLFMAGVIGGISYLFGNRYAVSDILNK